MQRILSRYLVLFKKLQLFELKSINFLKVNESLNLDSDVKITEKEQD